ncbi:MAG: AbrB/MazE/SpoVT family DNA-binding domain-containing protein [Candidatus Magasanikbacteria bacterium]|nr:AbrB/MazE/SpoVT family DNA-binding domain-containing protein [Candidatus Magasanikbacteria bacterium]
MPSFGMAVVGERGQIVIPKEMRDLLVLKKGDQLMLMFHNDSVVIIPREKMESFVHHLTTSLKLNPKPKK